MLRGLCKTQEWTRPIRHLGKLIRLPSMKDVYTKHQQVQNEWYQEYRLYSQVKSSVDWSRISINPPEVPPTEVAVVNLLTISNIGSRLSFVSQTVA